MTEARSRQRRVFDVLTTSLLVASAAIVLFSATPALLRLAGLGPSRAAHTVFPARSHSIDSDPGAIVVEDGDDDEPRDGDEDREPSPHAGAPDVERRVGQAKAPVYLHDMPDAESPLAGRLKVGEKVLVLREENGWVAVASQADGALHFGWAKKGEILVR